MLRKCTVIMLAVILVNCQSSPVSEVIEEETLIEQAKEVNQPTPCLSNNESEDCLLVLQTIEYTLPDLKCDPYELVVDVETRFFTPAGLGAGSTSRIDWEFFPEGNAGNWVIDLEDPIVPNSQGTISMAGCFSFGDQNMLRITRTITDEFGNVSNELVIEVEDPNPSKVMAGTEAEFEFHSGLVSMN